MSSDDLTQMKRIMPILNLKPTDNRSGITNDPNREGDPQYIVKLIKKVVAVSLETVEIVEGVPMLGVAR